MEAMRNQLHVCSNGWMQILHGSGPMARNLQLHAEPALQAGLPVIGPIWALSVNDCTGVNGVGWPLGPHPSQWLDLFIQLRVNHFTTGLPPQPPQLKTDTATEWKATRNAKVLPALPQRHGVT